MPIIEVHEDERGILSALNTLPFPVKRVFWVEALPHTVRGNHAHRTCYQILIPIEGIFRLEIEDRYFKILTSLEAGYCMGKIINPMEWITFWPLSMGGTLLVLASEEYDSDEYITDREEWENAIQSLG